MTTTTTDSKRDPKRDSIIERIRKLRRMTEAQGASENEALMAASQIAKLMAQYNVDETELRLKADAIGMVDDAYGMPGRTSIFHFTISKAIASFTHTKLRWRVVSEDMFDLGILEDWTYVKFYGYPLDVEAAIALCAICQTSIVTEKECWEKANKSEIPAGKSKRAEMQRKSWMDSFFQGICERLAERIRDFSKAESTGTALLVMKGALVDQHYAEFLRAKGLTLGFSAQEPINFNGAAYEAGRLAAANIDLGRGERITAS